MLDQPAILLGGAGREARHVHEGDDRMPNASQKRTKARPCARHPKSSTPASTIGWFATKATVRPRSAEAGDDVLGEAADSSKKSPSSATFRINSLIVGLVRMVRDQRVERCLGALDISKLGHSGTPAQCRREEIDQPADLQQALDVVLERARRRSPTWWCARSPAELFGSHHFVGDRLHHVRPGHEHVARVLHHEDEVGHGGRIDIAARARPMMTEIWGSRRTRSRCA